MEKGPTGLPIIAQEMTGRHTGLYSEAIFRWTRFF